MADLDMNIDIEFVLNMLESGNPVELPASGDSMFPTLRPGDIITVNPLPSWEIPKAGSVLVYKENEHLIMHRLVEIVTDDKDLLLYICRGDCTKKPDAPCCKQKLTGTAVSYKRNGESRLIEAVIPSALRYSYNLNCLWMFKKMKRMSKIFYNFINLPKSR